MDIERQCTMSDIEIIKKFDLQGSTPTPLTYVMYLFKLGYMKQCEHTFNQCLKSANQNADNKKIRIFKTETKL